MALTRDQVRRIDKIASDRYGIAGIVLMENAGRGAADIIRSVYPSCSEALICCGVGNNGGDGCVIARHLHNAGWSIRLLIAGNPSRCTPDTKVNLDIARAMDMNIAMPTDSEEQLAALRRVHPDEVVVDALLGTGFHGEVRSPTASLIDAINATTDRGTVAVDVPSGLDCDSGNPSNATVRADMTVTFVAPKLGFNAAEAAPFLGRVEVVDIGAPRELTLEVTRTER